jgi:hypothetical protein
MRAGRLTSRSRTTTWPACSLLVAVATILATAALPAACGGSSGGPSPASSTAVSGPTAQPSPQITSGRPPIAAVKVVRAYWSSLGEQDYEAAHALTTGSHLAASTMWASPPATPEVEKARFLRLQGDVAADPGDDATVEFPFDVHIVPGPGSPFGDAPVDQRMWARVVRMSDGSWRLVELGTGP